MLQEASQPITYTNWNTGEPDDAGGVQYYIEMIASGVWQDMDVSYLYHYATEFDGMLSLAPCNQ